jgi:hypothetical protein
MTGSAPGSSGAMTEDTSQNNYSEHPVGGHSSHHGRPRSWVLVGVVIAAFCAGGAAVIEHLWVLFWVCAGVVVLAVPVGKMIGIMDDTVALELEPRRRAAITGRDSAADPEVRLD